MQVSMEGAVGLAAGREAEEAAALGAVASGDSGQPKQYMDSL